MSLIRVRPQTADDVADCIEGRYGADAADHAYELIYDYAGDAVDCLWEFSPMGWLMMPDCQHDQIPTMF